VNVNLTRIDYIAEKSNETEQDPEILFSNGFQTQEIKGGSSTGMSRIFYRGGAWGWGVYIPVSPPHHPQ